MKAKLPANEKSRLNALHDLAILDTEREQSFDDVALVAMQLCDVPIAVVSLVDSDRQWFKSCIGLDATETPRDIAFCAHAILAPDNVLIVEDATKDIRFSDNALVTGAPHIRFYAGAPLVNQDGFALGTLCVIDYQPRTLNSGQAHALKALARQVIQLLKLKSSGAERKIHLQIMQKESARLAAILEGTNVGTWEWNILENSVYVNGRWASMLGYSLADVEPVTVETWANLLHPDDQAHTYASLNKHLSGETNFHDCQFRMRKKNGDWHWVHAHGKIVSRTHDGKPEIISGMHMDINDAKNTFDQLCEREGLLRSLLSNFPGAAYRCHKNGIWTMSYLSDAVEGLTGYPAHDFINNAKRKFKDIVDPQDYAEAHALVKTALADQKPFTIEYNIKRADGQCRRVQEFGSGIYNEQGELAYLDGFIWDIQARVDSEHEKNLAANKLAQLFEMAPIGIMQVQRSGRILEVNPEISKILGYAGSELKTKTFMDLTPNADLDKSKKATETILETGRFGPIEKNYYNASGELIPVEISGTLIKVRQGDEPLWWTLVKDIREQKRIEQMKSEFISTVSHELRTPLTSITGALGLLAGNALGEFPVKAKAMLDIANKNSQRLSLLINDLLDMEKLIAGKMAFECQVQSVLPLVQQALTENASYADKYSVKYVLTDASGGALIYVDGFRLQQVLNNFLSNAAKYSPPNAFVDIDITIKGEWLRMSVFDHGAGITDEFKSRIFQKFSQADSSDSRQKGGTGLGLAISKELVERMGGRIGFDTKLGEGTGFFAEFRCVKT